MIRQETAIMNTIGFGGVAMNVYKCVEPISMHKVQNTGNMPEECEGDWDR